MTLDELNNLDFRTLSDWPIGAKIALLAAGGLLIVGLGWWYLWSDTSRQIDEARQHEAVLKASFLEKKVQAINLDAYRAQLADIKEAFGALLKQLPNKQEMDALITDVNQAGLGRGLQFELFRPSGEVKTEFYAETPISVKVTGTYHDLAAFASDVAKLSRIVTIRDISMQPVSDTALSMDATVKTYRYLDDSEVAAQAQEGAQP